MRPSLCALVTGDPLITTTFRLLAWVEKTKQNAVRSVRCIKNTPKSRTDGVTESNDIKWILNWPLATIQQCGLSVMQSAKLCAIASYVSVTGKEAEATKTHFMAS